MTPALAQALRCPVCGGPLLLVGRSLRCPKAHSFDLAKEGYVNLLAIQKSMPPTLVTARKWSVPAAPFSRQDIMRR